MSSKGSSRHAGRGADVVNAPKRSEENVTRRRFIGRSAGVALAIGGTSAFLAACGDDSGGGGDGGEVSVLSFVSYIDPEIKKMWNADHPDIRLRGTPAGDDGELLTKLRAGGARSYDVVFTDFGYCPIYEREGLVEPLDLASLKSGADLYPVFREDTESFTYLLEPNKAIGFPCQWAPTAMTFNTTVDVQPSEPYSWSAMWNEAIPENKVAFYALPPEGFIATAALAKGYPASKVYSLNDTELKEIVDYLRAVKPFRLYAADPEFRNAIRDETAWIGIAATPGTAGKINEEAGKDVARSVVPQEGSIGFIDGPMLVKDAKNRENGLTFIDWFAGNPKLREYIFTAYRVAPCSQKSVEALVAKGGETERLVKELKGPEPEIATKIVQGQPPANAKAYAAAWDAVIA